MNKNNMNVSAVRLLKNNVRELIRLNKCHSKGVRSLAQLADAMGVSAPTLTHALSGNPRLDTIQKIADALNVPVSRLFAGSMEMEGYISTNGQIVHFHSLDELQSVISSSKK